jgi:hypothetical protein
MVLVLLAMMVGGGTSVVSIRFLLGVSGAIHEITDHDMALTRALTEVAAGHLEQAVQLERALRFGGAAPADADAAAANRAAIEAFEARAAEMWQALQRGLELGARAPEAEGPAIVLLVGDLDRRHNEYAGAVREVFAAFDDGRFADARTLAAGVALHETEFDQALRGALIEVSETSDVRTARIVSAQHEAIWMVAGMSAGALALGVLLMARVFYLVTQLGTLGGLLPICSSCKKIRDDQGYWNQLEAYVEAHSEAEFTHGLCGGCMERLKEKTLQSRTPAPAVA